MVARSSPADGLQNDSDEACLLKAIVLTREHKAIYAQERTRIQKVMLYICKVEVYNIVEFLGDYSLFTFFARFYMIKKS